STGIQNKVLEAMALGTPVIVSHQPAQALQALPGQDLLVADTPQDFAEATLCLLDNPELWAKLSYSGRKYVESNHHWQSVKNKLINIYQSETDKFSYQEMARTS